MFQALCMCVLDASCGELSNMSNNMGTATCISCLMRFPMSFSYLIVMVGPCCFWYVIRIIVCSCWKNMSTHFYSCVPRRTPYSGPSFKFFKPHFSDVCTLIMIKIVSIMIWMIVEIIVVQNCIVIQVWWFESWN